MGRKGNWFVAVKKAFSPESSEKKDLKRSKSKKKWGFGKEKHQESSSSVVETVQAPPLPSEEVKLEAENEQNKHAYSVALASAAAAEAAVAAAQAAAEVVRLTTVNRYPGKSEEEVAAIKIQTAFRGYLARRALRALRGLVRLKTLIDGQSVKRQATNTLRCMQTLARVQSQIRARRIRMAEENQALQRQLQSKRDKELENLRASMGEDWDDSFQSKEQIEANLQHKQEAAIRRERALAYAFSHQQMSKNSSRSTNPMFMDPTNPHWGWSWLERWMAARPWETRSTTTEKELNDHSSIKSASRSIGGADISKSYTRRELKVEKPSPTTQKPSRLSPSTPQSKVGSSSMLAGKLKSVSPRGNFYAQDEDCRSILSLQSERPRRHSIAGSSVRDDESLASSPAIPSYMIPTESARARARLQSPLAVEKNETPEKGLAGTVKKRLSFPASPGGPRRHSGPPKVDSSSIKNIGVHTENNVSNGGSN
ncbi:IQ motif [Macleaya cordata]|uniref:IQ motif n=1 Tax=Macleaya cordata TaxID=56857 RepID=A0A200R637_MACCD|nr:IQ motif [Macleaya cordata]